jgi:hypothetical protein
MHLLQMGTLELPVLMLFKLQLNQMLVLSWAIGRVVWLMHMHSGIEFLGITIWIWWVVEPAFPSMQFWMLCLESHLFDSQP